MKVVSLNIFIQQLFKPLCDYTICTFLKSFSGLLSLESKFIVTILL